MKFLIKRSFRSIKSNFSQFLSIVLIIGVGTTVFMGMLTTITSLNSFLNEYYTSHNIADAWIYVPMLTEDEVHIIQLDNPELVIEGRRHIDLEQAISGHTVTYRLLERTAINTVELQEGNNKIDDDSVLIDASFADRNNLNIGDNIEISLNGYTQKLEIKGTFEGPEFAYKSKDYSDLASDKAGFGILLVTDHFLQNILQHSDLYLENLAKLNTSFSEAEVQIQTNLDQIETQLAQAQSLPTVQAQVIKTQLNLAKDKLLIAQVDLESQKAEAIQSLEASTTRIPELLVTGSNADIEKLDQSLSDNDQVIKTIYQKDFPNYALVFNILLPITIMGLLFPFMFFAVSAIIILITMTKTVQNDRMQIAIFKAMGLSNKTIALTYLWQAWWSVWAGLIPFAILGSILIPKAIIPVFETRFCFPTIPVTYQPLFFLGAFAVAMLFASNATLLALRPILKESPASGMRPKQPKKTSHSFVEKIPSLWKKLPYTIKLILRNVQVSKVKMLFSSIGIIGAVALLTMGLSFRNAAGIMIFNSVNTYAFDYSIKLENDISFDDVNLPNFIEHTEAFSQSTGTLNEDNVILSFYQAHTSLYDFKDKQGNALDLNSDEVWITSLLADVHHLSVGDTIEVSVNDISYNFKIAAITNQYMGKDIIMSLDHAQALGLEFSHDRFVLKSVNGEREAEVATLRSSNQIKSVDAKSHFEDNANEMLGMLMRIVYIILLGSIILSITVIYNLASINIFERRREIATLRVLGYSLQDVGHLIYTENYMLWGLGVFGGIPLGIGLFKLIAYLESTSEFVLNSTPDPKILLLAIVLSFFFTFMTNRILKRKLKKIELVESLKAIE